MGSVYQLERDPVAFEAVASKYCAAIRSLFGEEFTALCIRIPRSKRLSIDARETKTIPRANDSQHNVLVTARLSLHAQAQLFASRFEA